MKRYFRKKRVDRGALQEMEMKSNRKTFYRGPSGMVQYKENCKSKPHSDSLIGQETPPAHKISTSNLAGPYLRIINVCCLLLICLWISLGSRWINCWDVIPKILRSRFIVDTFRSWWGILRWNKFLFSNFSTAFDFHDFQDYHEVNCRSTAYTWVGNIWQSWFKDCIREDRSTSFANGKNLTSRETGLTCPLSTRINMVESTAPVCLDIGTERYLGNDLTHN